MKIIAFKTFRLSMIVLLGIVCITLTQSPVAAANKCQNVVNKWEKRLNTYAGAYDLNMSRLLKKASKDLKGALKKELKKAKKTTSKKWKDPEKRSDAVKRHISKMTYKLKDIYFKNIISELESYIGTADSGLNSEWAKIREVKIEDHCTGD